MPVKHPNLASFFRFYLFISLTQVRTSLADNKEELRLLTETRDLIVMLLRHSGVPPAAIGSVLGISAKTVMNRYPVKGVQSAQDNNAAPTTQSNELT